MQRNMADVQREANLEQQEQIQATLVDQTDFARGAQFCIPGIHSTTTSEPATTEEHSKLDVSGLKERYKKLFSPEYTDDPQSRIPYIQLALVKGEKDTKANEKITKLRIQGQVDELLLEKEPLSGLRDIFHYKNKRCPRVILIMGGPGIGKTTLCHELCLNWAGDGFLAEDFKLVAFIPLYTVQERSLEKVVVEFIGEDNYLELKKSKGNRCLIILEGFDEIKRQDDSFLSSLIEKCIIFEKATILITSRPQACTKIDAGRIIEVVGFEKDKIEEFAKKYFSDGISKSDEFLQQLDKYQLRSLCYIPMNLEMLAKIFCHSDTKMKLPSTITELYKKFLAITLNRKVKKPNVATNFAMSAKTEPDNDYVQEKLKKIFGDEGTCISIEMLEIVWCLSKLAYQGFFNWFCHREGEDGWEEFEEPKIIFSESDLTQCKIEVTGDFDGFGLLKATPIYELTKNTNTYNFNHLTIQEFLCAVYISLQSKQEQQLDLLWKEYPNVFTFVCGLTELTSDSDMFKFIHDKLLSQQEIGDDAHNLITAMRCINESKQSSGPHQSVSPVTLNINGSTLSPYDFVCVSHVLSCYPVLALKMRGCHIGNKGVELLVNHYPNSTGQLLEELDLSVNDLTSEGMKHVMKIVRTSSATLRVLDVSKNDISDDGMAVISKALRKNQTLTTLKVEWCGLSVKGAEYISQLLNVTHTLEKLNICFNDIGDDGMALISKALHRNKSLTTLKVEWCGLSVKGAEYISQLLNVTHTLEKLNICFNDIGDDGMALISKALHRNKSLTTLAIEGCRLSVEGANSISKMMMVNHSLQKLTMGEEKIGLDGISAIARALGSGKINILALSAFILIEARPLATASSSNQTVRKIVSNLDYRRRPHKLQQPQITENIMESNDNSSEDVDHSGGQEETRGTHGDDCHDNRDEEVVNKSPTKDHTIVDIREGDHSEGQEETRGFCCVL